MKRRFGLALLLLSLAAPAAAQDGESGVEHMRHVRPVVLQAPGRQHFIRVDDALWTRARRDLGDLRLLDAEGRPVPYALRVRGEGEGERERRADILQPGRLGGRTRFWIRIPDEVEEYNRVRLAIRARDFVVTARVEGGHAHDAPEWIDLGESTLFDFSRERLGASLVLQLPATRFRFLRVTLPGELGPEHLEAAHVASRVRQEAGWMPIAAAPEKQEERGRTVFRWSVPEQIPLERVRVDVEPGEQSFIRRVDVLTGGRVVATGTVRRVHLARGAGTVRFEELDVAVPGIHGPQFEAVIHDGDDRPLPGARLTPFALERRLYFEAPPHDEPLRLYFGDPGTERPRYDYDRLFREDPQAQAAALGPTTENPGYRARPDGRPWTERHPWVLWSALVLAVAALGALAVRSLRTA